MIAKDVVLGENVRIFQPDLVNLYGCSIGDGTKVGAFVEVQRGAARCNSLLNGAAHAARRRSYEAGDGVPGANSACL
jgi:acetyltransferase-like isoleucine patch superfamily enzyme